MKEHEELAVFSPEAKKLGELLLHHQCWFFGRDILHPDGNLLLRYGFERFKAASGKDGTNRYRFAGDKSVEVDLWGFGLFYGNGTSGGLFIRRYDFNPRLFEHGKLGSRIFKFDHLPVNRLPVTEPEIANAKQLTVDAISWILSYEDWIENTCGKDWRRKCLREWANSEIPARNIKTNWQKLARQINKPYKYQL